MIELLMRRRGMATKVQKEKYEDHYLTFEALESGTFQFSNAINYSLDGGSTWVALEAATDTPTLSAGDKILWKATLTPSTTSGSEGIGTFSSTGEYNAMGNPLSLRLGDSFQGVTTMPNNNYMFYKLFLNSTGLISAKNLSLVCTTIRQYCYNRMFYGCSNLVDVCDLPATTLIAGAYGYMFYGCSSLTKAPYISADYTIGTTTAAGACLGYMFYECTSMTSIDKIPSNNTSTKYAYAYDFMFYGCSSLASIPSVTINLSKGYEARSMFRNCSSLLDASPITFSGTTVAYKSCENMFNGCTALTTPPASISATQHSSNYGCTSMFSGCSALLSAPILSATTLKENSYDNMFLNCTSLVSAPALPATTLTKYCYRSMFQGCTALTTPPTMPVSVTLGQESFKGTFKGCTSLTVTPETKLLSGSTDSCTAMFQGCTVLTTCKITFDVSNVGKLGFSYMFDGCTSLLNAPEELPSPLGTTDNSYAYIYRYMFQNCKALKVAPRLLATNIDYASCQYMFNGCSALETVPMIADATLDSYALQLAFSNCTSLKYIKCLITAVPHSNAFSNWVQNVQTTTGIFVKHPDTTWSRGNGGIPNNWTILEGVQITITYTGGNSGAYLKEIGGNDTIHTFVDGEAYEADLDDAKSYGVYDSSDNLVETLTTPFNRTNNITI